MGGGYELMDALKKSKWPATLQKRINLSIPLQQIYNHIMGLNLAHTDEKEQLPIPSTFIIAQDSPVL
jgi:hypothetical protein